MHHSLPTNLYSERIWMPRCHNEFPTVPIERPYWRGQEALSPATKEQTRTIANALPMVAIVLHLQSVWCLSWGYWVDTQIISKGFPEDFQMVWKALLWTANALSVVKHLLSNQLTTDYFLRALGCLRVWSCLALAGECGWVDGLFMTLPGVLVTIGETSGGLSAVFSGNSLTLRQVEVGVWGMAIYTTHATDELVDYHSPCRWELLEQMGKSHEIDHSMYHSHSFPSQASQFTPNHQDRPVSSKNLNVQLMDVWAQTAGFTNRYWGSLGVTGGHWGSLGVDGTWPFSSKPLPVGNLGIALRENWVLSQ